MIGGDQAPFDKAKPIIDNYARMATLIGPAGAGQLTKMVNQIIVAITVQGVSEGLAFAQRAGLDIPKVMETIAKGAAQSWQMDNRWKTMNESKFDFGFAVDWMRKDLGIIMDEAERNGAMVEIAKIIDGYYAEVQKMGGNRWDTSALIARLNKNPNPCSTRLAAPGMAPSTRSGVIGMAMDAHADGARDGVGDGGCRRHDRHLADATHAIGYIRHRGLDDHGFDARHVERGWHAVVEQAGVAQATVGAIVEAFQQRPTEPLHNAALNLALDRRRIERQANVLKGGIAQDGDKPAIGVDSTSHTCAPISTPSGNLLETPRPTTAPSVKVACISSAKEMAAPLGCGERKTPSA